MSARARRCVRCPLIAAILGLGLLAVAPVASAATFTVNDSTDAALATPSGTACVSTHSGLCTLRAAVQAADNTGGTSMITLPAGTYTLTIASTGAADPSTGDLDVTNNASLTITGAGPASTTINPNHLDRAFAVDAPGDFLSISGVTVRNGSQPNTSPSDLSTAPGKGGAFYTDGTLSIDNCVLIGNSAKSEGGGVYADTGATSTSITNSTVTSNTSSSDGGVVAVHSGSITLTGDTITHNGAEGDGGAVYDNESGNTVGAASVSGSDFSDDAAAGQGGAIYVANAGAMTVSDSRFDANHTPSFGSDGGAIYDQSSGTLTVTGSSFASDNAGVSEGGAIALNGSDVAVSASTFTGDAASQGGAIYVDGSSATASESITTSSFSEDSATIEGGAVHDSEGNLVLSSSTFADNSSADRAGGLYYSGGGGLALTNDTFDGNTAAVEGGAIVLNSTASTGTIGLFNDTITRNSAYDGGGIYEPQHANSIMNTIVAGNSGGTGGSGGGDCYFAATDSAGSADLGGNIDGDGTCFLGSVTHDQINVDPLLGQLAANGGPTETDALLPGSPAIGNAISGACPAVDQRGVPRTGPCDSGAFQTAPASLALAVSGPSSGTAGSPVTYTLTVTNSGPGAASNVVVSDALPSGATYFNSGSSQGTCAGTTTVTCSLGTIDSSNTGSDTTATVTLVLIPSQPGSLVNAAQVDADNASSGPSSGSWTVTVSGSGGGSGGGGTTTTTTTQIAPVVATGVASEITPISAALSAVVNPANQATTFSLQFGTGTAYGTTLATRSLAADDTGHGVAVTATGLVPNTTYHFRVMGTNATGTSDGQDVSFTTPKARPTRVALKAGHTGRRYRFTGRVVLPAGVSASAACTGSVTILVAHGRQLIARATATLGPDCQYTRVQRVQRTGNMNVVAYYGGNTLLTKRRSGTILIRIR